MSDEKERLLLNVEKLVFKYLLFFYTYFYTTSSIMHKAIYWFLFTVVLWMLPALCWSQEQFINTVNLATSRGDTILTTAPSKGLVSLKDGGRDFKVIIGLFPIVPNSDAEDSLEQQNKPLLLKVEGQFPISNMDFLTTANNGMTGTINASIRGERQCSKYAHQFFADDIAGRTGWPPMATFPGTCPRINMAFRIDPKSFGLNTAPFDMKDVILIEVPNAIISRTD